jgi:glutathione S-transferase
VADKAVSLLYGSLALMTPSRAWTERCTLQIADTLQVLDADRASRDTPYWLGETLTHADVAFACAFRFTREAHPGAFDFARFPALLAHSARCEEREEFRAIFLPITNNL